MNPTDSGCDSGVSALVEATCLNAVPGHPRLQGGPSHPAQSPPGRLLADLQAAYAAAVQTAGAAYSRIWDPAAERYAKAEREALEVDGRVDRKEVDARLRAGARAREAYQSIVAGPAADVDQALREAGRLADEHA
jgi:hypothetical protein